MDHLHFYFMAQSHSLSLTRRPHNCSWPSLCSIISLLFVLKHSNQRTNAHFKKQTLVSSFPSIAPIPSVPFSAKLLSTHHLHTPSSYLTVCPLCKPGTDLAPSLTYNLGGTWDSLYHLSLAFGLWSQRRQKESHFTILIHDYEEALVFFHCLQGPYSPFLPL